MAEKDFALFKIGETRALAAVALAAGLAHAVYAVYAAEGWDFWDFCSNNGFFWAKRVAFVVTGLLSVPHRLKFIQWRKH